MEKRKTLVIKDAYYKFDAKEDAQVYESNSYDLNRADSIEWAERHCKEDLEIRRLIFKLRRQFRERLLKEFPGESVVATLLEEDQEINQFFGWLRNFANGEVNPSLKIMALFFCEKLKLELNLDLHPSFFKAERSHSKPPPKHRIRIPEPG